MGSLPRSFRFPWRTRRSIEGEIDDELRFHLDMHAASLMRAGLSEPAARAEAVRAFGNIDFTKRYCEAQDQAGERAMRFSEWIGELRHNVEYAVRTFRRNPGYAIVAVLTMLIGIGANAAIFTVTDAVLLRPLPYKNSNELVIVYEHKLRDNRARSQMSPADLVDYRAAQSSLTSLGTFTFAGYAFQPGAGTPSTVEVGRITPNVLDIIGTRPLVGRLFLDGEDAPERRFVAVLSFGFWQRQFGGDSTIVGRDITLQDRSFRVVGVMPEGFSLGQGEQVWVPLDVSRVLADPNRARKFHFLYGIGRLKPGVTIAAASADLNMIAKRLEKDYPEANTGHMVSVVDMRTALSGDLRPTMILLSSAAALVLLIACANLANLIVARGVSRRRELAVRAALGAGRARLARQVMTETVLLAVIGGATAILVAAWGTRALLSINPEALPPFVHVGVDARMLTFAAVAAAVSGLLAGLLPSLAVTRVDLNETLKESSRTGAGVARGDRVRRSLVIAQTGLAVMLLVGSGLLIRSLRAVERVERGFDSENVMTATVSVHGGRYDSLLVINAFYNRVMSAMRASPGIASVGAVGGLPLRGGSSASLSIEGSAEVEGRLPEVGYITVAGDYFQTLRIPLLQGRFFNASDGPNGPGALIINTALATTYFPGRDPVGQRIRLGPNPKDPYLAIVGVVGDVHQVGLERDVRPTAFVNNERDGWSSLTVVARGTHDAASTLPVLRDAVRAADPTALIDQVATMDEVVGASLSRRRFALVLLSIFAGVSLCLAALGVYGVLAYAVAARRREFGLRLALGAETSQVIALVLRQGLGWALTGIALGVIGARAATRVISGEVFGVTAADPWTYAAVSAVVVATALIACLLPVRRATRVDPATSLRED